MGATSPGPSTGLGVGADLSLRGLLARQLLPPLADRDICLFTTDRHIGVGRIGYAEERFVELPFHGRQFGVYGIDPPAQLGRGGPQLGNLPATGLGPSSDRLTDSLRCKVAFRLQPVAFVGQLAPADVELDRAVHDGGILALVDRALADSIVVFAEALGADAHDSRPSRTAASSRSRFAAIIQRKLIDPPGAATFGWYPCGISTTSPSCTIVATCRSASG